MQRLVSAGDAQQLNTIVVGVSGTGRRAGAGTLVLSAKPRAPGIAAGEAAVPVRVV